MRSQFTDILGSHKNWLISGIATSLMLATVPVQAATIQAEVDWTLGGIPRPGSPDIDGPATSGYVDVLAGDNDPSGNNVFYHTYGDVTGNFGSRVSGNGNYDITGLFTYKDTFVNPNPFPSPATFTFNIIPGELNAYLSPSYTPAAGQALFARYEIDIRLNGTSIWDSSANLQYNGGTNTFSFADTGTYSLVGTLNTTPTSSTYSFGPVTKTIPLGTFAPGETFLLEYDLKTIATGNLPTTCTDGSVPVGDFTIGPDNGTGQEQGACGGSTARSGDPFNPNFPGNSGTVTGAVSTTIPEPSNLLSLLVLGGGIGGSSIRRWYRRKNSNS
ncbi:MAG: PEP-CTERM sorting domain-containing protein [Microcystis aeruginosa Ma_QC_C_20070703_M131]|uniref:PEP-CTERM sorting domain-containing protein n=1 Tax=Microcystis aeruginosa Ma_QC_C_20070703_M131 TaxID=2486263 RepID=A0A551Y1U2_MICAE|nr:MAG: PEP-CTERM sorting domain-containing protein [Microcystis aeruginosa Ma_QC_C_20070703_M131]